MAVNRERVQLWVEALDSGEFKQTQGCLREEFLKVGKDWISASPTNERAESEREYRYCCLGVAIQVALRNGLELGPDWGSPVMGWEVVTWYGFDGGDPVIDTFHQAVSAVDANDVKQYSFNRIADSIRSTYLPDADVAE